MDLLEAIIDYIIVAGYATVKDTDIFKDTAPVSPDELVAVYEYNGTAPAAFTDMSVRSVQVTVRAKKSSVAKMKIWDIYRAMHREDLMITLGGKPCLISMRNTPMKIGVDEKHRNIFAFNCGITTNIN